MTFEATSLYPSTVGDINSVWPKNKSGYPFGEDSEFSLLEKNYFKKVYEVCDSDNEIFQSSYFGCITDSYRRKRKTTAKGTYG